MNQPDTAIVDAIRKIVTDVVEPAWVKKLARQAAFQPIEKQLKRGYVDAVWLVQACLEQPVAHALNVAARALIANGELPWVPYLLVAGGGGGPKRSVKKLRLSAHAPIVYAFEDKPRVGVWSMETGEHVRDVKVPTKGPDGAYFVNDRIVLHDFADMVDGTLWARTPTGIILKCKPGDSEFSAVLDVGEGDCVAVNGDYSRIVRFPSSREYDERADGTWAVLDVHHVDENKVETVEVLVGDSRFYFPWLSLGRYAVIPMRDMDDGDDHNKVGVFDFESHQMKVNPVAESVNVTAGPREGTAVFKSENKTWLLEAATSAITRGEERLDSGPRLSPDIADIWREQHKDRVVFVDGKWVERQEALPKRELHGYWGMRFGVFDARTGRFAVVSETSTVHIVERFDPSAPRAEKPVATPLTLTWARSGVVLRYSIADFDSEDEWTFEVIDASADGLVMRASAEGDAPIEVRFGAEAIANSTRFARFSQGHADTKKDALPPFMLSQAMFAKVASGKKLAWKSEWTDKDSLEPGTRGTAQIEVDGASQTVLTWSASGEEVEIEVLDDAAWPLLVKRVEADDCHVNLVSVDLSKAKGVEAPLVDASKSHSDAARGAPSSADGWQRYECIEGGASKFWEVTVEGCAMNIRFGKIGTSGQAQAKSFTSEEKALAERDKLIREKTKKGYRSASS